MAKKSIFSGLFKRGIKEIDLEPVVVRKSTRSAKEAEEGKAVVAKKGSSAFGEVDNKKQNVTKVKMLYNAYKLFPLVAAAIDSQVEQVVQDFRIEGPQKEALTKWADNINLKHHLRRICKGGLIGGTIWAEKLKLDAKEVKGIGRLPKPITFKHFDSRTMRKDRSTKGKLLAHVQTVNNKEIYWGTKPNSSSKSTKGGDLDKMFCWDWNLIGSDKYGTSLIESSLPSLNIKDQIESDLRVVVKRYIAPIIHAKVGDELHPADETSVNIMQAELEDIWSDTEYVTNHLVDMRTLDLNNKSVSFEPILDHFDNNIITGLQTDSALLAGNVGNKGSEKDSEIGMRANGRHIKAVQDELRLAIEDQIFKYMTGNSNNKLIWERVEERQFEADVEILTTMVKNGIITQQKANDLLPDQYREALPEMPSPEVDQKVAPDEKVKDNPNDPTKTTKSRGGKRTDKKDLINPKNAKKKPQKMENKRML